MRLEEVWIVRSHFRKACKWHIEVCIVRFDSLKLVGALMKFRESVLTSSTKCVLGL